MIKSIKGSLFAKVFLITGFMLLCISLLVFGMLAWLMPRTYSNRLNRILDERTLDFVSELEQTAFAESGGLFDRFTADMEIHSVELYNGSGDYVPLPTRKLDNERGVSMEQTAYASPSEVSPVLSNRYYFSFAGRGERYTLVVYGAAEHISELKQSFLRVFPLILLMILTAALAASWLFSRMITRPVLEISRISEKMSALQLDWKVEAQRTDELGTLGKSLNTLSRSLSGALSDLQSANRKLEADMEHEKEIERSRSSFFSAASHELKTPVTVIKGQLEGMLLGIGDYKDHKKYLTRALEVANTLETMVQEILTVSRLETAGGYFKREPLDCVQMIRAYLNETEDFIIKKELQIRLDIPPGTTVYGNKALMEKVFSNLIGNAVKYSPQGASVGISAHLDNGRTLFSVENTGTHIPEESIPKLFEAFYRVEQSRSRETGGSGLGLYIVQEILRQHNSECRVCNTPSGVTFSFAI